MPASPLLMYNYKLTNAITSPPNPAARASRSLMMPLLVEMIATPRPCLDSLVVHLYHGIDVNLDDYNV
jgi:hypothetical protein